ncbi:hypothetical protein WME73_43015 [Sorangium sp. So ce302]
MNRAGIGLLCAAALVEELEAIVRAQQATIAALELGQVRPPHDIGSAVAMLLSPESQWINGQRIEASGGMVL